MLSDLCRIRREALQLDQNGLANQLRLDLIREACQLSDDIVCSDPFHLPRQGLILLSVGIWRQQADRSGGSIDTYNVIYMAI